MRGEGSSPAGGRPQGEPLVWSPVNGRLVEASLIADAARELMPVTPAALVPALTTRRTRATEQIAFLVHQPLEPDPIRPSYLFQGIGLAGQWLEPAGMLLLERLAWFLPIVASLP